LAAVTEGTESQWFTARITILRTLTEDDDLVSVEAVDSGGDDLPLVESLGLLRMAEDTIIRRAMGEEPEEDEP
jgi:hypothetical protein